MRPNDKWIRIRHLTCCLVTKFRKFPRFRKAQDRNNVRFYGKKDKETKHGFDWLYTGELREREGISLRSAETLLVNL